ncbi:MAG: bacteriohemerythrin [Proteobacteria bacterium]|nr:bacteriohemerythrin [Pseudomonadota bacterium]
MSVIKWRDSYNTGVAQFDQEHHKIIELIDSMYVALRDKLGSEVVEKVCREAITYTEVHFTNEEQAMSSISYPELEEHKVEHLRMKKEVEKFQTLITTNFTEGATGLYHFLRDWLINHILVCDKKYGPYLQEMKES